MTELTIEDTDFEKHADFFKSTFTKGILEKDEEANINEHDIGFKAINFKGLALFGDTIFERKLIFKYVTFESFSHFRKAKLYGGLDLDYWFAINKAGKSPMPLKGTLINNFKTL